MTRRLGDMKGIIIGLTANFYGVSILAKDRSPKCVLARKVAIHLLFKLWSTNMKSIGAVFEFNRSVAYRHNRDVEYLIPLNEEFENEVNALIESCHRMLGRERAIIRGRRDGVRTVQDYYNAINYTPREPDVCSVFGCGKRLSKTEYLFGNKCISHNSKE